MTKRLREIIFSDHVYCWMVSRKLESYKSSTCLIVLIWSTLFNWYSCRPKMMNVQESGRVINSKNVDVRMDLWKSNFLPKWKNTLWHPGATWIFLLVSLTRKSNHRRKEDKIHKERERSTYIHTCIYT